MPWFDRHLNNMCLIVYSMKLNFMQFSVTYRHFLCFRTKFCPQKRVLRHLQRVLRHLQRVLRHLQRVLSHLQRVLRHLQRVLKQATDRLTHQLEEQCRIADTTVRSILIRVYTLGISVFKFWKTKLYWTHAIKGHVYSPNKLKKLKLNWTLFKLWPKLYFKIQIFETTRSARAHAEPSVISCSLISHVRYRHLRR